jgi:hypothetical protein
MSGGRFSYMNDTAKSEIFGWCSDEERIPNVFEDREISELIYDVFDLIHDYDWYASGDTCKETYLERKKEFKKKWLSNSGVRVRKIIDESVDALRTELYETYGMEGTE